MAISLPRIWCYLVVAQALAWGTTQDFGQTSIGAPAKTLTLTYSFAGLSAAPSFSLAWNRDFLEGSPSCTIASTTSCSITVSFGPLLPGQRQDSLVIKNQSGIVLATTALHGVGLGPLMGLSPGVISTLVGNGTWGYQDSPSPTTAMFRNPQGIALDGSGTTAFVADSVNGAIRKIALLSGAVTTVVGNGSNGYSGDGGPATSAVLNTPTGVAVDGAGNLYIADQGNNLIRRVDAISQIITTVAGGGTVSSGADNFGDGGPALSAILFGPQSVAVDVSGNLFIADAYHNLVRYVNALTGNISVVAGGGASSGTDGYGDGGAATNAILHYPSGVALDSAGNLYIADTGDNMIRRVDMSSGVITAVGGNGNWGYSGDTGLATYATLASPQGVRVDAANNIYVADYGNNAIRLISAASQKIFTLAGRGSSGYAGDGGNPTVAFLTTPTDLAVDENGDLYIADCGNNVVRRVLFTSTPLAFPSEAVGAVSAAQVVSPINIGNQPLNLSTLTLSAGFQQVPGGFTDCVFGATLEPGASCDAAISFVPTQPGSIGGTLQLTTNSLNRPGTLQTVNLSGSGLTGSGPVAYVSVNSLSFNAQLVSTTSAAQTFTFANNGGTAFSITNIMVSGPATSDFQLSTNCPIVMPAATPCTVSVTFTPTMTGTRSATLLISDLVAGSPQSVTLTGTGNGGVLTPSPTALTFTGIVGATSASQTILLSNSGSFPLHILGVSVSGTNASNFGLSTTCGSAVTSGANCSLSITFTPAAAGDRSATLNVSNDASGSPLAIPLTGTGVTQLSSAGLRFIPLTPCRIADTRNPTGSFGGPILSAGVARNFIVPNSSCGVPVTAQAYSLNFTVVPPGVLGFLAVWPSGQPQPAVSLLNSDGRVKAGAAIVPAGASGGVTVYASHNTQVIIDINGYFVPATNAAALGFYPLTPCRIADTRTTTPLAASVSRDFSPLTSSCNISASAQAYSLNFTALPKTPIGFLSTWPSGQPQPVVSTLNTSTNDVTANAAIVPAGTNGNITVYSSSDTDVVIDVNGYFAPAVSTGVLSLYNLTPCRMLDTRTAGGSFSGTMAVNVVGSSCGVPSSAQAFVMNATVVPQSDLGFLSLWQDGAPWPGASTLNAGDMAVTSNMAIVPTNNGLIDSLASSATQLILDIAAYFAP
jgi:sugar lactone lactonase YvrE